MRAPGRVTANEQRCGTCGHGHLSSRTTCAVCGCGAFTFHPDDVAANAAREAAEREEYGGRAILAADEVEALAASVHAFERGALQIPWGGLPPQLFVVTVLDERVSESASVDIIEICVNVLALPPEFWDQMDGPGQTLCALALSAEQQPHWFANFRRYARVHPQVPILAWGVLCEAWAQRGLQGCALDDPSRRDDEVRTVSAVDVDGRHYFGLRSRYGRFTDYQEINTPRQMDALARQAGVRPLVYDCLVRLSRLTTQEYELRGVLPEV